MKENYTSNMTLQKNEEKMKLIFSNLNEEKEKNKSIIKDLEKKLSDKDNEIKELQNKLKNNIKYLIEENKSENLEFVLDEINDRLKIIYKGELICYINKYKREIPTSFLASKKYNINSNIHPSLSEIRRNNIKSNRQMTMQNNQKVCEINNFNITYKLSQNEYEFDYSNSSQNKISNNSDENSGICLDKLCQQMSNSTAVNKQSSQKSKSKSIKKNNLNNYVDNFFKNYYEMNKKKLRRSMTDFKGRKFLNKNNSKFQSFGLDVESIKEE